MDIKEVFVNITKKMFDKKNDIKLSDSLSTLLTYMDITIQKVMLDSTCPTSAAYQRVKNQTDIQWEQTTAGMLMHGFDLQWATLHSARGNTVKFGNEALQKLATTILSWAKKKKDVK